MTSHTKIILLNDKNGNANLIISSSLSHYNRGTRVIPPLGPARGGPTGAVQLK